MSMTLWQAVSEVARHRLAGDLDQSRRLHQELTEALPDIAEAIANLEEYAFLAAEHEHAGRREDAFRIVEQCMTMLPGDDGMADHVRRLLNDGAAEIMGRRGIAR